MLTYVIIFADMFNSTLKILPNYLILCCLCLIGLQSCTDQNPNVNTKGEDILYDLHSFVNDVNATIRDTIYVPIYSDIYSRSKNDKFNLTATLSIRNTSLTDTLFIENIDYYDSDGKLVREYINKTLILTPLQSIEYVINENDNEGGTGANFIVNWAATTRQIFPVIQGVMISTYGQQGISFITQGTSIKHQH